MEPMKQYPRVSILIPVYNREKLIVETLDSAVSQTYKNIEVIAVDNKSTDNTFEILKKFARSYPTVKVYQNKENIGPVRNWRRCLEYATGEYIKILWSDDFIHKSFVEKTLAWLVGHDDIGFVCTGVQIFLGDTKQKIRSVYFSEINGIYNTKEFIEKVLLGGEVSVSATHALFRKQDLEKNILISVPNKIGSDFSMHAIGPDALMFLLTAKEYPRFAFINETLAFYRAHSGSISISTNSSRLIILHLLARAYFVENYLSDDALKRRFNARILSFLLRGHGRKSGIGVKSVQDFYLEKNKNEIDYIFMAKLIYKKLSNAFAKRILHKEKIMASF